MTPIDRHMPIYGLLIRENLTYQALLSIILTITEQAETQHWVYCADGRVICIQ